MLQSKSRCQSLEPLLRSTGTGVLRSTFGLTATTSCRSEDSRPSQVNGWSIGYLRGPPSHGSDLSSKVPCGRSSPCGMRIVCWRFRSDTGCVVVCRRCLPRLALSASSPIAAIIPASRSSTPATTRDNLSKQPQRSQATVERLTVCPLLYRPCPRPSRQVV